MRRTATISLFLLALGAGTGCAEVDEDLLCPADTIYCDGTCHMASRIHCGVCGNACGEAEVCVDGGCQPCGPGTTFCGEVCIDEASDPSHCGGCDRACSAGEGCVGGVCGEACSTSEDCAAHTRGCSMGVCEDGLCEVRDAPDSTVCRPSTGLCDIDEICVSGVCPEDSLAPASTECREAVGACDEAETCTGLDAACPEDRVAPSTTVCRAGAGACDSVELCTGSDAACPPDTLLPATVVCRSGAGLCDVEERCSGSDALCPADALASAGTECRAATRSCDAAETCSGMAAFCPSDELMADGATCPTGGCLAGMCNPLYLPGLVLWTDASVAANVLTSGSDVTQWTDLSGGARHLLPLVSALSTAPSSYAPGAVGGLGAISFAESIPLCATARAPFETAEMTYFAVAQFVTSTSRWSFVIGKDPYDWGTGYGVEIDGADIGVFVSSSGPSMRAPVTTDTPHILRVIHIAGVANLYVDGTLVSSQAMASDFDSSAYDYCVGAAQSTGGGAEDWGMNGHLGEVLHYDRALTDAEITSIEAALRTKWSVL